MAYWYSIYRKQSIGEAMKYLALFVLLFCCDILIAGEPDLLLGSYQFEKPHPWHPSKEVRIATFSYDKIAITWVDQKKTYAQPFNQDLKQWGSVKKGFTKVTRLKNGNLLMKAWTAKSVKLGKIKPDYTNMLIKLN